MKRILIFIIAIGLVATAVFGQMDRGAWGRGGSPTVITTSSPYNYANWPMPEGSYSFAPRKGVVINPTAEAAGDIMLNYDCESGRDGVITRIQLHLMASDSISASDAENLAHNDSSTHRVEIKLTRDGVTIWDWVPIEDCFGAAECGEVTNGIYFGKSVRYRGDIPYPFDADYAAGYSLSIWYLELDFSFRDSVRCYIRAYESTDKVHCYYTFDGFSTPENKWDEIDHLALYATYVVDTIGNVDYTEAISLATDTTESGFAGSVAFAGQTMAIDGTNSVPIAERSVPDSSSRSRWSEGAWVGYFTGNPLFTNLSADAKRGANTIYVDSLPTGWTSIENDDVKMLILRHTPGDEALFQNYAPASFTLNPATNTITFTGGASDTLPETFLSGSEVALFYVDTSAVSQQDVYCSIGTEEEWPDAGHYAIAQTSPISAAGKQGWTAVASGYRTDADYYTGTYGSPAEPHSWYWCIDPPVVSYSDAGGDTRYIRKYWLQNFVYPGYKLYSIRRLMFYWYATGAGGEVSAQPTYTKTAAIDTFYVTAAGVDGSIRANAVTWQGCIDATVGNYALADGEHVNCQGKKIAVDNWDVWRGAVSIPISTSEVNFYSVDSMKLLTTFAEATGANGDSIEFWPAEYTDPDVMATNWIDDYLDSVVSSATYPDRIGAGTFSSPFSVLSKATVSASLSTEMTLDIPNWAVPFLLRFHQDEDSLMYLEFMTRIYEDTEGVEPPESNFCYHKIWSYEKADTSAMNPCGVIIYHHTAVRD